jgi:hypothetical protein
MPKVTHADSSKNFSVREMYSASVPKTIPIAKSNQAVSTFASNQHPASKRS